MNTIDENTPAAPHSPGYPGGEYPHEDEIDLVDLVAVLYRRRSLIVVVTLIFALAATGSRLILPEKYTARAVVEIGKIAVDKSGVEVGPIFLRNSEGGFNFEKVESLAESEAHIRDIGNVVIRNMQKTGANGEKPQGPGFSLKDNFTIEYNDKGSNLELQLNASHDSEALSFLSSVTREFVHNHNRIFDWYREDI